MPPTSRSHAWDWRPASAYRVYELWNEEYRGTFRGRFRAVVPPAACRLYRIARARPYPWLLGTDLHVQQGAAEITSLSWDEASMTLTGAATRPAGERGNLFFLMPRDMSLINHSESFLMKEVLDMNVVVRRPIHFASERDEPSSFASSREARRTCRARGGCRIPRSRSGGRTRSDTASPAIREYSNEGAADAPT